MAKRTDEARKLEKAMQKEAERLFKEYIKDNPDLEISGDRVNVFVEANDRTSAAEHWREATDKELAQLREDFASQYSPENVYAQVELTHGGDDVIRAFDEWAKENGFTKKMVDTQIYGMDLKMNMFADKDGKVMTEQQTQAMMQNFGTYLDNKHKHEIDTLQQILTESVSHDMTKDPSMSDEEWVKSIAEKFEVEPEYVKKVAEFAATEPGSPENAQVFSELRSIVDSHMPTGFDSREAENNWKEITGRAMDSVDRLEAAWAKNNETVQETEEKLKNLQTAKERYEKNLVDILGEIGMAVAHEATPEEIENLKNDAQSIQKEIDKVNHDIEQGNNQLKVDREALRQATIEKTSNTFMLVVPETAERAKENAERVAGNTHDMDELAQEVEHNTERTKSLGEFAHNIATKALSPVTTLAFNYEKNKLQDKMSHSYGLYERAKEAIFKSDYSLSREKAKYLVKQAQKDFVRVNKTREKLHKAQEALVKKNVKPYRQQLDKTQAEIKDLQKEQKKALEKVARQVAREGGYEGRIEESPAYQKVKSDFDAKIQDATRQKSEDELALRKATEKALETHTSGKIEYLQSKYDKQLSQYRNHVKEHNRIQENRVNAAHALVDKRHDLALQGKLLGNNEKSEHNFQQDLNKMMRNSTQLTDKTQGWEEQDYGRER